MPNVQDPLPILKDDIFASIFRLLPSNSAVSATRVNTVWKKALESNPTLFQYVSLTRVEKLDRSRATFESTSLIRARESTKTINSLSRLSELSQNGIKGFAIILEYFWFELRLSDVAWKNTKLAKLINVLSLSANTLQEVLLVTPVEDLKSTLAPNRQDSAKQVLQVLRAFQSFPALKALTIKTKILLTLESEVEGRTIQIQNDAEVDEEVQPSDTSIYLEIMQIMAPTGGITSFGGEGNMRLESVLLKELEKSKGVLKWLSLNTEWFVGGNDEIWRRFAISCPTSMVLSFQTSKDQDHQSRHLSFEGAQTSNDLRWVGLRQNKTVIKWDDNFVKWCGNGLGSLTIRYEKDCFQDYYRGNLLLSSLDLNNGKFLPPLSQMVSILQASSATLKFLTLDEPRFYHLSQDLVDATQTIELPNLQELGLRGSPKLVNFFLSNVKSPSLKSLHILAQDQEGFDCPKIDLINLLTTLKDCKESLENLHLTHIKASWLMNFKEEDTIQIESIPVDLRKIHLPNLSDLAFAMLDRVTVEILMGILEHPNLKNLRFPKDSSEIRASVLKKLGTSLGQEAMKKVDEKVNEAKARFRERERDGCSVM